MKKWNLIKHARRNKRAMRVRKKIQGNHIIPRLSVIKSNSHIHVQLIDDVTGVTLGATSTLSNEFKGTQFNRKNKASAKALGEKIAEIAQAKNIKEVVFDRGHRKYHGILAELADSARSAGLKF